MRFDPRLWRGGPLTEHLGDHDVPMADSGEVGALFGALPDTVPAGRYPVRVLKSREGARVAAAMQVGQGEPVSWSEGASRATWLGTDEDGQLSVLLAELVAAEDDEELDLEDAPTEQG